MEKYFQVGARFASSLPHMVSKLAGTTRRVGRPVIPINWIVFPKQQAYRIHRVTSLAIAYACLEREPK